ncbi:MAG: hypothetical protein C4576_11065 [Desulfobacteraceae bacterium]|nr:MAG: hypothetical protein C4576_11065 [Desulfobacteraceae bacterium]
MPAGYAHLMITDKALARFCTDESVEKGLRGVAYKRSQFVQLGCLGPDYPYLDLYRSSQKVWADHMHYDFTGDLQKSFARKLIELKKSHQLTEGFVIPFCWTLGYISHVTADLVVHPVVEKIVGPYEGNETEHRQCEMIQDSFIYNKVRNGAEIEHSALLDVVKRSSDPEDEDKIHPVLRRFWDETLRDHFAEEYAKNAPRIDDWHDHFEEFLGFAGKPMFVGKILDPKHKFTYKRSDKITAEERRMFLEDLPFPDGSRRRYETLFDMTIEHVLEKWTILVKDLEQGKVQGLIPMVRNCNLDTGKDKETDQLFYWV